MNFGRLTFLLNKILAGFSLLNSFFFKNVPMLAPRLNCVQAAQLKYFQTCMIDLLD
jgi:hypothetical protein